jgi:hypothetical protein
MMQGHSYCKRSGCEQAHGQLLHPSHSEWPGRMSIPSGRRPLVAQFAIALLYRNSISLYYQGAARLLGRRAAEERYVGQYFLRMSCRDLVRALGPYVPRRRDGGCPNVHRGWDASPRRSSRQWRSRRDAQAWSSALAYVAVMVVCWRECRLRLFVNTSCPIMVCIDNVEACLWDSYI